MGRGKLAVGIDIGSSSVKLVHLRQKKAGYVLQAFGTAPLPPEAIIDGALMNSAAVTHAIETLVSTQKVKTKDVAIGVRGHSVIVKKISLPRMTQDELDESIQWEAEQYIPFEVNDVNIDTQILATADDPAGQMDVLLVAAKKEMINDYTSVCVEAGLSPAVVDVDAFAVQNAYELSYQLPPTETIVLINAGAAVTNINILADGVTTFTRDVTTGGNVFTEEIQKQLSVSYEEAEALKIGGHGDSDAVVPQEVDRIVQSVAEQLADEIQRSLDFYAATTPNRSISRIFLSGGTARVTQLVKAIEQRAAVGVELLNPFKGIDIDARRFDEGLISGASTAAAVAVGLALRRAGDA